MDTTLLQLKQKFVSNLSNIYSNSEATYIFFRLLEHYSGMTKTQAIISLNEKTDDILVRKFSKGVELLKTEMPVDYVIGFTEFLGLKIKVSPDVLIPRPETEELVRFVQYQFEKKSRSPERIIDFATGSGCIAIALKKIFPNADVFATDISASALELAKENAENHKTPISFFQQDLLSGESFPLSVKADLIVSNPPYIPENEKVNMQKRVKDFEPSISLFCPTHEPLLFYKALLPYIDKNLQTEGLLFVEINENLSEEVVQLFYSVRCLFNVEVHKDIFGKNRFVSAQKL